MDRNEALGKVRKLLAMRTDRGCTEAEASAAAGMAAKIMMAHSIEAASLDIESAQPTDQGPIEIWDDPLDTTGGAKEKWRSRLAVAIARQFGCEILKKGAGLTIIGRPDNVQVVRYVYAYAAREVSRLTISKAYGNGRIWVRSYRLGLIDAIRESIKAEHESARREATEKARTSQNQNALVLVSQAIARTSPQTAYLDTKAFLRSQGFVYHSGRSERSDGTARDAGRRDGAGIYSGSGQSAGQIGTTRRQLT